jgi:long-chain acyl-CoA synthetase
MTKDDISESLNATLQTVNTQLENYERVEKIVIMREPWSLDNGLLTPSLKLKRSELEKKYLPHYNSWFMHAEPIVWDK